MDAPALLLQLLADPLSAYGLPTPALEQVQAVLRASYGGGPEASHFRLLRRVENEIAACLRARQANARARQHRLQTVIATWGQPPAATPPPAGGWRVRTTPPKPTRPPGGAAVSLL